MSAIANTFASKLKTAVSRLHEDPKRDAEHHVHVHPAQIESDKITCIERDAFLNKKV